MSTFRSKGVIIKKINLGEADKILTIFTDNLGKIKVCARGARRSTSKFGGHLDLLQVVDMMLAESRKTIPKIISVQTLYSSRHIRSNLEKTSAVYYLAELIDKFTLEGAKDTRIFNLLVDVLKILDRPDLHRSDKIFLLLRSFELKLLKILGFLPEMVRCVRCRELLLTSGLSYFSALFGGVLCTACRRCDFSSFVISGNTIKILKVAVSCDFNFILQLQLEDNQKTEVKKILEHLILFLLEKRLKSSKFIKKVEGLEKDNDHKLVSY